MDYFEQRGFYVEGVDISAYAVEEQRKKGRTVYHASLDDLSAIPEKSFDIGFCNDAIEHVPEQLVRPSMDEMARICSSHLLVSVCPTASHHLSSEGENLHLTVRPESWWTELFKEYGNVQKLRFLFSRSARYAINLQEKTIQ